MPALATKMAGQRTNAPGPDNGNGVPMPESDYRRRKRGADYIVDPETNCWVWQKSLVTGGYGRIEKADGTRLRAHRVYYEKFVGGIPEGYHLHHVCQNRRCVNPEHLTPLSDTEHKKHHFRLVANKRKRALFSALMDGPCHTRVLGERADIPHSSARALLLELEQEGRVVGELRGCRKYWSRQPQAALDTIEEGSE